MNLLFRRPYSSVEGNLEGLEVAEVGPDWGGTDELSLGHDAGELVCGGVVDVRVDLAVALVAAVDGLSNVEGLVAPVVEDVVLAGSH